MMRFIRFIKDNIDEIVFAIIAAVLVLIAIAGIAGSIQAWVLYANKPITEVPMWALWFLQNRG